MPEPQPRTPFQEERPPDESRSAAKRQKVADPFVNQNQDYQNTNQNIMPVSMPVPVQQDTFTPSPVFGQPFIQGPSPRSPTLKRRKTPPAQSSPSFKHNENQESESSSDTQTGQPFNIVGSDSGTQYAKMEPLDSNNDSNNDSNIKLEPVGQDELELEITGVELGSVGSARSGAEGFQGSGAEGFSGDWGQDTTGGYPHSESGEGSMNQSGSQYSK